MKRLPAGMAVAVFVLAACGSSGSNASGSTSSTRPKGFSYPKAYHSSYASCMNDPDTTVAKCNKEFPNGAVEDTTTTTTTFVPSQQACGAPPFVNMPSDQAVACAVWSTQQTLQQGLAEGNAQADQYNAVQPGMTLQQVQSIVGATGVQDSAASVGGQTSETWTIGPVIVSLLNGRVAAKARVP